MIGETMKSAWMRWSESLSEYIFMVGLTNAVAKIPGQSICCRGSQAKRPVLCDGHTMARSDKNVTNGITRQSFPATLRNGALGFRIAQD
jgi:hypothetical protein